MYSPGTLVRCIVTSVEKSADGRRSIKLSIDPKKVNNGLNASALASGMVRVLGLSQPLGFGGASCTVCGGTFLFVFAWDQRRIAPAVEETWEERAVLGLGSRLSLKKSLHLILFQYEQVI